MTHVHILTYIYRDRHASTRSTRDESGHQWLLV